MVKRYKGGLMGSTEAVTSTSDSRGMWGTVQATQARNTGNWAGLLATETPGSGSGAGFANGFMTVSNVAVTDSGYNVLNDTPNISTAGGFIKLTGRGFVSGCVVYVGGVAATSTTFISSTEVRAQIAATTSNTLMVYVVNPDGSTGIKLSSLTFSGTPSWATGATLTGQVSDTVFSIFFSATSDSAVSYALSSGSSLPPGTSLFANGLFTGTVTGISSDTTYSFSVDAIDAENQDTARTFSVSFSTGDAYFYLTPVLLNGDANVWIRDSSANNFLPTVGNDTRPVAFSPYNSNWSGFFDGTGDNLSIPNGASQFGTGDYAIELWLHFTTLGQPQILDARASGTDAMWYVYLASGDSKLYFGSNNTTRIISDSALVVNRWYHVVISRVSTVTRMFIDGTVQTTTYTDSANYTNAAPLLVGQFGGGGGNFSGYMSNLRILIGSGYTTVTVPTAPLTAIANTRLLTLHTSRFIDGSTNAYTVTPNGDVSNRSFAPFADTDTTTGSAYFDGTGDHLIITDNTAMELGAGDFSFECWVYPTSVSNTGVVIDKRSGTYGPILVWRSGSTLQLYMSINGSSWLVNGVTVGALVANRWFHVAVYRVGSSIYTAFNGTVTLVTASGSGTLVNNAGNWYLGTETNGSSNPWTGYISNMRFVVGSSPYGATNFVPPTALLSAITNTQFLSLQYRRGENNHRFVDESGIKALTTRAGNAHQGTFSPFSPAGWSAYFDGTGDYVVTNSAAFAASQSTFTIECWIFMTAAPNASGYGTVVGDMTPTSTAGYWSFGPNTSRNLVFQWFDGGSNKTATGATTLALSTWHHIAVSVNANAITLYVNGNSESLSGTTTLTNRAGTNSLIALAQFNTSSANFTGYVSNLSILSGTAKYSGSFTPATSGLAADTTNQVFLFGGTNRFIDQNTATTAKIITRSGDARIQPFNPFRGSGFYTPATHGGSAYFDGSGDYVYIANNAAMTLGTNDHCIEFWMYPNGAQARYSTIWFYSLGAASGATNTYYMGIGSDSGGYVTALGGPLSGSWAVTLSMASPSTEYNAILNTWTHVAITRRGSAYRLFLNGVLKAYTTYAGSIIAQGSSFSLGWDGSDPFTYYKGWLSGFRVVNGNIPAAYQTASTTLGTTIFTPPTAVPAFEANTAMAMNFTNGGIIDATGRQNFETVADTKISNVASKFGTGSLYFDGTGDYLYSTTSTNLIYPGGSGDITAEAWVYTTSTADQTLFYLNGDTNSVASVRIGLITSGVYLLVSVNGSSWNINSGTVGSVPINTWKHVAVVRNGGTFTVYVDGSSVTSSTAVSATSGLYAGTLNLIGAMNQAGATLLFAGYMDDLRITRYARYTSNFTPPTQAHLTR